MEHDGNTDGGSSSGPRVLGRVVNKPSYGKSPITMVIHSLWLIISDNYGELTKTVIYNY